MPIRFRCAYCSQLMAIAKRKAGTVVKCPKCTGEIIVPVPEDEAPSEEPFPDPALEPAPEPVAIPPQEPPTEALTETTTQAIEAPAAPQPMAPEPPRQVGIFLSIGTLAVSIVVVILMFILLFVLGLIIGRQTAPETKAVPPTSSAISGDSKEI